MQIYFSPDIGQVASDKMKEVNQTFTSLVYQHLGQLAAITSVVQKSIFLRLFKDMCTEKNSK